MDLDKKTLVGQLTNVDKFFVLRERVSSTLEGSLMKISLWVQFTIDRDNTFVELGEVHPNIETVSGEKMLHSLARNGIEKSQNGQADYYTNLETNKLLWNQPKFSVAKRCTGMEVFPPPVRDPFQVSDAEAKSKNLRVAQYHQKTGEKQICRLQARVKLLERRVKGSQTLEAVEENIKSAQEKANEEVVKARKILKKEREDLLELNKKFEANRENAEAEFLAENSDTETCGQHTRRNHGIM